MKAIKQTVKQKTVVNVTTCCRPSGVRKRKCREKRRFVRCERICGRIYQKCNGKSHIYFRVAGVRHASSSILKIENSSDCLMKALICFGSRGKIIEQTIDQYQDTVFVINNLKCLKITCTGAEDNSACSGKFVLRIRFKSAA
ncbi:S-Ena type endospore appendage [Paenibacillus periandrae]|uniref:S-Ena type endospore appendage n=1 Tax=Paenibacillus periandrae TaxID=1761741 RepID=UPI001F09000A|nr:S-Ena type endospore appendage [Paenibacillus periandrae]